MKPISYRTSPASILGSRFPVVSFRDLAKDITIAYRTELKDAQQLRSARTARRNALELPLTACEPGYRGNLRELLADKNIQRALLLLDDALELCYDVAKLSLGRSALLDAAFERATLLPWAAEAAERSTSRATATGTNVPRATSPRRSRR